MAAKTKVEPTFASIFRAVEQRASKARFLRDTATQITLKGNLDNLPIYVKSEEGRVEVAPYEYYDATFYIDADADVFAAVLSGTKDFYAGLAEGSITVNGNTDAALLFAKAFFG